MKARALGNQLPGRGLGILHRACLSLGLVILAGAASSSAQVFQLQGGSSSLFQAHGGSVEFRAPSYEGSVGLGTLDGLRWGASFRTRVRGYALSLGDDALPFRLPTDIFDSSHYFLVRGVGVGKVGERSNVLAFAGTTSVGLGTSFFRAATSDRGVGLVFLEHQLAPRVRAFSRNVVSDHQTSINGLEWQPRSDVRLGIAGGVGANRSYFASSLAAEREWISVKAGYIKAGDQFRRIMVQQPLASEIDRENILVTVRPKPFLSLTVGHQNFVQPPGHGQPSMRGTVDQYRASLRGGGFRLSGSLFRSRVLGLGSTGSALSVGRDIGGRVQTDLSYFRSRPSLGPASGVFSATVREVVSPRLNLVQFLTHSNGRTSVSFGGNFLSNRFTVGIEYQTFYVPFRAGNQFKQGLVLNIGLQPFGNLRLNTGTFVAPDGSVKYTIHGGTFLYREIGNGGAPRAVPLYDFVVRGRVVDMDGRPIRGAALRIDGALVFSDSEGRFLARKRKAGSYRLQVVTDQFMVAGEFEVVSAPETVKAASEDAATEITVVLVRRGSTRQ